MGPESVKKHVHSVTEVGEWTKPRVGTQNLRGTGLIGQEAGGDAKINGDRLLSYQIPQTEGMVVAPEEMEGSMVDLEEM